MATKAKAASKTKVVGSASAFSDIAQSLGAFAEKKNKGQIEDLVNRQFDVIPSGMLGLDIAMGVGGFPTGRIYELYGMESCGKSTLCYHIIREAQQAGKITVMVETEGAIDPSYMKRIGVDFEKVLIYTPDNLEAAIDFIEQVAKTAKEAGEEACIILDSVAALAPEVVMEDNAEKKFRAVSAGVWSQQMPKIINVLRSTGATLFMVNQMREGMDLYSPPSTPGGKAIKFAASGRVLMRRKLDKAEKGDSGGVYGQDIFFVVEKNKFASPRREGNAYLPANKGVDLAQDVLERAIERGLIEEGVKFEDGELIKKGNWYTLNPSDTLIKAIEKDIQRADDAGADLPGKGGSPYLSVDAPISWYHKKPILDTLDLAPNLVHALRDEIIATLKAESEYVDSDNPFEARLKAAIRERDPEGAAKAEAAAFNLDQEEVPAPAEGSKEDALAEFDK